MKKGKRKASDKELELKPALEKYLNRKLGTFRSSIKHDVYQAVGEYLIQLQESGVPQTTVGPRVQSRGATDVATPENNQRFLQFYGEYLTQKQVRLGQQATDYLNELEERRQAALKLYPNNTDWENRVKNIFDVAAKEAEARYQGWVLCETKIANDLVGLSNS
jgi:hypothetical protein